MSSLQKLANRKSLKLESLPKDLRSEANKLIAKKFPEPEIQEAKKKSGYDEYGPFKREYTASFTAAVASEWQDYLSTNLLNNDFADTVSYANRYHSGVTDEYTKHNLEQTEQIPEQYNVTLEVEFSPIGTFQNMWEKDMREFQREIKMHTEKIIVHGGKHGRREAEAKINAKLDMLVKLYKGAFHYKIHRIDVMPIDRYGLDIGYTLG